MALGSGYLPPNVERFCGFADRYDSYRPQPPRVLVEILSQWAGVARPHLVVDLGSGTGLSTRIWAGHADEIVGIEPNADMRKQAEARTKAEPNMEGIAYRDGYSTATGLANNCADVVTCSQSLHWMEPQPTFVEIARILRPGGVFAAYDCDWPPTVNWEAEAAYKTFVGKGEQLGMENGWYKGIEQWDKPGHLGRIKASGCFRYVKDIVVHNVEEGNAERLVGLALSQGSVASVLAHGVSDDEMGLPQFRAECERTLGDKLVPWYWSYRVRIAIK